MKEKKVGIITLLYNSINAGGVLQAYALYSYIKECGYDVEHILFDSKPHLYNISFSTLDTFVLGLKYDIRFVIDYFIEHTFKTTISKRRKSYNAFIKENICTSKKIYNINNKDKLNQLYDIFIAGGDQIWNYNDSYFSAYYLDFVDNNKIKFSYAASMTRMIESEQQRLRLLLADLDAIAVRENEAKKYIDTFTDKPVVRVVDPVFLLETNRWEKFASGKMVKGKYVFVYLLGDSEKQYKWIREYVPKDIKIVSILFPRGSAKEKKI